MEGGSSTTPSSTRVVSVTSGRVDLKRPGQTAFMPAVSAYCKKRPWPVCLDVAFKNLPPKTILVGFGNAVILYHDVNLHVFIFELYTRCVQCR